MPEREGRPKSTPTAKPERALPVPLSVEEKQALATEAIARMGKDAEDVLGLNTAFAKKALAPQADAAVPPVGVDESVPKQVGRRRKSTSQRTVKPPVVPVDPVNVSPAPVSADVVAASAAASAEEEPIVMGRYRDHEEVLCDVREEGGIYYYTILEGPDKGQELRQSDANQMRALMGDEWQKVLDTTEPIVLMPDVPVVPVLPITPDAAAPVVAPALNTVSSSEKVRAIWAESPVAPEVLLGKEPSEAEKLKELIDGLRTKVGEARLEYVTTDYRQNSAWMKLKRFFGKSVGEKLTDQDTQSVLDRYNLALAHLQEAELALLKQENLSGGALRERMGKMLNFYKLEERVNLAGTRDQVKMEAINGWQTLITVVESIGREYNKLPRGAKYALGGVCLAGGLLTGGGVIGGGAAAAASGLILMKRLVATTGLAVTVDTFLEGRQEKKMVANAIAEREGTLDQLGEAQEKGEDYLERLGGLLKADISALDTKFREQKKQDLMRRSAVWGVAVAGALGMTGSWVSHALEDGGGSEITDVDKVKQFLDSRSSAGAAASAPEMPSTATFKELSASPEPPSYGLSRGNPGASFADGAGPVGNFDMGVEGAATSEIPNAENLYPNALNQELFSKVPGGSVAEPGISPEMTARIASLREDYTVNANGVNDGKKGLWGILERRLPEGLPKGEQNRVIASLENAMRAKLDAMSPAERALAGFHGNLENGRVNLDLIRPGDKIDFGALLTPQEIQSVLDGQSVGAPGSTESIVGAADVSPIDQSEIDRGLASQVATPMEQAVFDETVTRLADQPFTPLDQPVVHPDPTQMVREANVADFDRVGNAAEYLRAHPENIRSFNQSLGHLRQEIFLTNDVLGLADQSQQQYLALTSPDLGKMSVSQVLRDYTALRENPFTSYDRVRNPLHFSQMQELDRLLRATGKAFGAVGSQIPAGATIDDVTRRLTTIAFQEGKSIPRFLKINP